MRPDSLLPPAPGDPLWPLPLLAGLLPAIAVLIAWAWSAQEQLIPVCNPFVDGCISISRAARVGLANYLFRALVLPAAVLQSLTWWLAARWLVDLGAMPPRRARVLAAIGVAAGLFLILYASFLGTEGNVYRWARRYGVVFYFGCTCIGMLFVADAARRATWRGPRQVPLTLLLLACALPALGIVNAFAPLYLPREVGRDVVQNVTEWWGGLVFSVFFAVLARLWATTGFCARFGTARRSPDG